MKTRKTKMVVDLLLQNWISNLPMVSRHGPGQVGGLYRWHPFHPTTNQSTVFIVPLEHSLARCCQLAPAVDVPGQVDDTVILYGHLDKQPEMVGWDADLGPWKPVLKGDKLYGRGGADDGYAAFASLTAINGTRILIKRSNAPSPTPIPS